MTGTFTTTKRGEGRRRGGGRRRGRGRERGRRGRGGRGRDSWGGKRISWMWSHKSAVLDVFPRLLAICTVTHGVTRSSAVLTVAIVVMTSRTRHLMDGRLIGTQMSRMRLRFPFLAKVTTTFCITNMMHSILVFSTICHPSLCSLSHTLSL